MFACVENCGVDTGVDSEARRGGCRGTDDGQRFDAMWHSVVRCGAVRIAVEWGAMGWDGMGWDGIRYDATRRSVFLWGLFVFFLNRGQPGFSFRLQFVVRFEDTRIAQLLLLLMMVLEVVLLLWDVLLMLLKCLLFITAFCSAWFIFYLRRVKAFDITNVSYTWYMVSSQ